MCYKPCNFYLCRVDELSHASVDPGTTINIEKDFKRKFLFHKYQIIVEYQFFFLHKSSLCFITNS